jgi:hypothetical protein
MNRALAACIVLFLCGCATTPRAAAVRVDVEEQPAARRWRVHYEFPRPVSEIAFPNTRAPFRSTRWTIVEPAGATWNSLSQHDTIVFRSPTTHATVEFADDFSEREKDYLLNVAFTDGSRLLYTGHLRLSDEPHTWRFHTAADRTIRTPDRSGTGSLAWSSTEETYVYFGSIVPVSTPRMTLIVDPGLHPWIAKQLRERVPPMFDYYAAKMKTDLGFRPLVLLSYGGAGSSGFSFKGGTVRGLVQLDVSGSGWSKESAEGAEEWYRHVAHEVFHLWESQRFLKDDRAEWLGESTAEYASMMAFHDLGGGDTRTIHRRIVEAANDCITTIGDTSLSTAIDQGHFRNVYSCGLVTQWIAAARTGDAWQLFRKTFDRPAPYTTADYLSSLRATTSSPEAVEQLASGHTGRADLFLAEQLRTSGIAVHLVSADQATVTQAVLRKALSAVVTRCTCRIELEPLCSGGARIETVDGISGRFKPGDALARVMRSSELGDVLTVNGIPMQCSNGDLDSHFRQLLRIDEATP